MHLRNAAALSFGMASLTASLSFGAIFGVDDRRPVWSDGEVPLYSTIGDSIAVSVLNTNRTLKANGKIDIDVGNMSNALCSDEKFSTDPSINYACTGFLVGPNLLATAGHCYYVQGEMKNETGEYCGLYDWLFDYRTSRSGHTPTTDLPAENLFRCKKIIYAVQEFEPPYRDFALVELDRPAFGRKPLPISTTAVQKSDSVFMLGHPFGTPMKLSANASVRINDPENTTFVTTLDSFEGNSGSPVFNVGGQVVGILIAGTPSLSMVEDKPNQCAYYNRCDSSGANCVLPDQNSSVFTNFQGVGSEVQRIKGILDLLSAH